MRSPALILIVEDDSANREILKARLMANGYEVITAHDGEQGLNKAKEIKPDLILLDIMMPKMDGLEVLSRLKKDQGLTFMPIIMITAKADSKDMIKGFETGCDEYLTKPIDHKALITRVKSMLKIKELHDTVLDQKQKLAAQSAQLRDWNKTLENKVAQQLTELERISQLKRFLSPQIAELITSQSLLESHRREITVVFCDLRGFTAFSETGEPEEVMGVLRDYHQAMGHLIFQFKGTLERFTGDGLMVFFNDPVPCDNPAEKAVQMALKMRESFQTLNTTWSKRGHNLGFGVGIAQGYATLGKIGFKGRFDYAAIGPVTNLASRLCDLALNNQILISQRVYGTVEDSVKVETMEKLTLKGFSRALDVYNVVALKESFQS